MEKEELIDFDRVTRAPIYGQPVEEFTYPTVIEDIPLTLAEEVWDELPQEEPVLLVIDRTYFPNYDEGDCGKGEDKSQKGQSGKKPQGGDQGEESEAPSDGTPLDSDMTMPDDGDGDVSNSDPDQEGVNIEAPVTRDVIEGDSERFVVRTKDRSWFEL